MNTFEQDRRPLDDHVHAQTSGAASAIDPATVGATFAPLGRRPFVNVRGVRVRWILVAAVAFAIVAMLVNKERIADLLTTLKRENCKCAYSIFPPQTGHWHQNNGVWKCESGVGMVCP